jgi:hypothetical protein
MEGEQVVPVSGNKSDSTSDGEENIIQVARGKCAQKKRPPRLPEKVWGKRMEDYLF